MRHDHLRFRIEIHEELAAGTTGRHDRDVLNILVRFRVAHCYGALDCSVAFQHDAADGHSLCAHLHPADSGAEVQAGPDPAIPASKSGRDHVPEWAVMRLKCRPGSLDERFVRLGQL